MVFYGDMHLGVMVPEEMSEVGLARVVVVKAKGL